MAMKRRTPNLRFLTLRLLYADAFMFGGPQGVQCIKKEDFVRVLPKRKEFFRSVGLVSSKIESLEASNLDSKYVLVKAFWKMRFESSTGLPIDSENSSTYILAGTGDSFQIVVQLDHQDLMKKVQDLCSEINPSVLSTKQQSSLI